MRGEHEQGGFFWISINLGLGLELVLGLELGIELGLSTYIRGIRVKSNELKKQGRMCWYFKTFI